MKYLHDTILDLKKKKELKGRAHHLNNQDANQGPKAGSTNSRIFEFASNETKLVPKNLDPGTVT
jgi:hypothetical protein